MFLRWTSYRDTSGRVRLYARLVRSWREGKNIRHRSIGSLYVRIHEGANWSAEESRAAWAHLDHVLERYSPSPVERENIERAFARKVGERPSSTALEALAAKLGPLLGGSP
jgi:hypothetical protein